MTTRNEEYDEWALVRDMDPHCPDGTFVVDAAAARDRIAELMEQRDNALRERDHLVGASVRLLAGEAAKEIDARDKRIAELEAIIERAADHLVPIPLPPFEGALDAGVAAAVARITELLYRLRIRRRPQVGAFSSYRFHVVKKPFPSLPVELQESGCDRNDA